MQSFMYKRVNIFLMVMMCLIVIGLAGTAIYFQESFKSLSTNYEGMLSNFTTCTDVLSDKEKKLSGCIDELNVTSKDIGTYDALYEKKEDELSSTMKELELTDKELKKRTLDLQKAQNLYQQELGRVQDLERQIGFLNQQIIDLKGQLNSCQTDLRVCGGT